MEKISIITVTYNCEKVIEETILNVLSQDYPNIEYIIVDGASKDKTLEIINKYSDRIDKIVSEPDKGVYDAMNKAVSLATGKWINFMNAGDSFYDKHVVSELYEDHPVEDVIFGDTNIVSNEGSFVFRYNPRFWKHKLMPSCHQSIFVSREMLLKYPFDMRYKVSADVDSMVRIRKSGASFKYKKTVVANYDTTDGISQNPKVYYKEIYEIAYGKPICFLFYYIFVCKQYVRKLLN